MRRLWVTGACALACGPLVGMPSDGAEGDASAGTTSIDSGLDATSAATSTPGTTAPDTTAPGTTEPGTSMSSATSIGETSGSEGADEGTGADPGPCAPDATPIGAGMVEWEYADQTLGVIAKVAVDATGVTLAGDSVTMGIVDDSVTTIQRFDLAGNQLWSYQWWPSAPMSVSWVSDAMAIPGGLTAVHVGVHSYVDGDSMSIVFAIDDNHQVSWETPVYPTADVSGHSDVLPTGNVAMVHRFDDGPAGFQVTEIASDGAFVGDSFTETPWTNPYDVATGPGGEIVASGSVDYGKTSGGFVGRWLPTLELDLWLETPDLTYDSVEVLDDGRIVVSSFTYGNPGPQEPTLHILDQAGVALHVIDLPHRAFDLEIDCLNRIVIGGELGVMLIDAADGALLWAADVPSGGWSVAVDAAGDVFAAGGVPGADNQNWTTDLRRISGS